LIFKKLDGLEMEVSSVGWGMGIGISRREWVGMEIKNLLPRGCSLLLHAHSPSHLHQLRFYGRVRCRRVRCSSQSAVRVETLKFTADWIGVDWDA